MTTRLIKLDEVKRLTGLGKTAIYKQIADGAFPRPAKVGASSHRCIISRRSGRNAVRLFESDDD